MYQQTLDTYINICPQNVSYIPESSSSFHSDSANNTSYPFHIYFKPQFATQFSRHIRSVFPHYSCVSTSHLRSVLSAVSLLNNVHCMELKPSITHLFLNVLTLIILSVSKPCERANTIAQWGRINIHLTS